MPQGMQMNGMPSSAYARTPELLTKHNSSHTSSTSRFKELLRLVEPMSIPPERVSLGQVIGQGANGKVMMAVVEGRMVAVKHIDSRTPTSFPNLFEFIMNR